MLSFARHHRYLSVFLAGTLLYLLACLPALIYRGGLFYYFGDYVYQTIEFYTSAHAAVHAGYLFWNPNVELGGSMAGVYGFYLWGSPFFWMTIPLPTTAVPYALPVVMAVRYGTATVTAFLWIRQFTRSDRAAFIGALLYAFSGFQANNVVFSHFHDVTAFFPLYLYAFDRLAQDGKRVPFVLMTALMACLNYYFFFGEVVFLILYYVLRYRVWRSAAVRQIAYDLRKRGLRGMHGLETYSLGLAARESQRRRGNRRLFANALLCGILGLLLAAAFLVQTVLGVMGNSRLSEFISGEDLLAFTEPTTFWHIVKSAFFVPELMGRQSLFNNGEIQWASVSLYLPCLAIAGVIGYLIYARAKAQEDDGSIFGDWQVRMLTLLAVMAVIPGLSAIFSAFNSTFYARWYYLPILLMASMTAQALERAGADSLRTGAKVVFAITLFFLVFSFLPGQDEAIFGGLLSLPSNMRYYILIVIATLAMLVFLWLCLFSAGGTAPSGAYTGWTMVGAIAFCCALSTGCVLLDGCLVYSNDEAHNFEEQCLRNTPELDESSYARIETDDSAQNWALIWGLPVNRTFLSTPAVSTFDIYDAFEDGRIQESNISMTHPGLRHLMSTRYYLRNITKANDLGENPIAGMLGISVPPSITDSEDDNATPPTGYIRSSTTDGFAVYETPHFVPMGFTFNSFMRTSAFEDLKDDAHLSTSATDRLLMKDILLTDEQREKYGHLMEEDAEIHDDAMSLEDFYAYADERAATACESFSCDPGGYWATTTLDRENLVFFSIPWDRGFSAYVDGQPVDVEKVDYGFIAVDVPAGTHEIRLAWKPWGIEIGVIVSLAAAIALIVIALRERR